MLLFFVSLMLIFPIPADPVRPLVPRHATTVSKLCLSPDLSQLASLSLDGEVLIWDMKTKKVVMGFSTPKSAVAMIWPKATTMLTVGSGGLANIDPVAGKVLALHSIKNRSDAGAISPDGRFAAVGNTHFIGKLIDVKTGNDLLPFPAPAEWSYAMAISSDGQRLAIAGRNPDPDTITILETSHFRTVRQWPTRIKDAFGLCFSPDGQLIASAGDGNAVNLWNAIEGKLQASLPLAQPGAIAIAFSPDNKRLAAGCGVPVHRLSPNHFDAHSNSLADSDKTRTAYVQVWDVEKAKELWRSKATTSWPTVVLFLADSKQVVSGHQDGTISFWETGEIRH